MSLLLADDDPLKNEFLESLVSGLNFGSTVLLAGITLGAGEHDSISSMHHYFIASMREEPEALE